MDYQSPMNRIEMPELNVSQGFREKWDRELSPRMQQIIRVRCSGVSREGTAAVLGITPPTVKAILNAAFARLGLSGPSAIGGICYQLGRLDEAETADRFLESILPDIDGG